MQLWLVSLAVGVLYLAAALSVSPYLKGRLAPRQLQNCGRLCAALALLGQIFLLSRILPESDGLNLSLIHVIALVSFMISLVVWGGSWFEPVLSAGLVAFPLTAAAVIALAIWPAGKLLLKTDHLLLDAHILFSLMAYSMLGVAAALAILLWIRESRLRRPETAGPGSLPPLLVIERMLFQYLVAGFLLLTLALGTGFAYFRILGALGLWPKVMLAMVAWVLFGLLLWGHRRFGWRGRTAAGWTLSAFAALALSYFGTQLVWRLQHPTVSFLHLSSFSGLKSPSSPTSGLNRPR
jgi:ABC-type uncharacterized transport system permease subunit